MTINRNLVLTLTVALLALMFSSAFGLFALHQSQQRFAYVQENSIRAILDLANATAEMADLRAATLSRVLAADDNQRQERDRRIAQGYQHLDDALVRYSTDHVLDRADREMLDADIAAIKTYRLVQVDFIEEASRYGPGFDITELLGKLTPATARVVNALQQQTDYNRELAANLATEGERTAGTAMWALAIVTVVALLVSGGLAVQLYRVIRNSVGNIQRTLQTMDESLDLTIRVPIQRMNEIGRAAESLNRLIQRIGNALHEVRQASDSVGTAASEIAAGNADLSSRTEEQAAALEQTVSSMGELTSAVRQNADSAHHANKLAKEAAELADRGHDIVMQVADAVTEIDHSSERIGAITGVIESIAFQTNILALNAAVEAARAGEQGRGFAVVASEVRTLAQRSSSAAKEIKDLIASSVRKIHDGASLASEAGEAISHVKLTVGKVTEFIAEIAASAEQQSQGISEVNRAISQMDQVTQQNAALVEQAAAAAKSLEDQGAQLGATVGAFVLTSGERWPTCLSSGLDFAFGQP
ncbi:methyl-accepting chemotaxis protein [Caballeronia sp. LjRoot34]|uniref:methyl-accepting chemotaxis protein n=1 Tax=Caballeronia sp. LjRoot34 TaxID=3342325 RepID=UPI003ECE16D8